jgi:hypothetical protein
VHLRTALEFRHGKNHTSQQERDQALREKIESREVHRHPDVQASAGPGRKTLERCGARGYKKEIEHKEEISHEEEGSAQEEIARDDKT